MKRPLNALRTVLLSRATSPVVIGIFLLLYIGLAFGTDETLTALIQLTSNKLYLALLLALLPLNYAGRLVVEVDKYLKRRRAMAGRAIAVPAGLFDETVELQASPALTSLRGRLEAEGYRTRRMGSMLAAFRGISLFPARMLFLAAAFCLFAGILISLTGRVSHRAMVIEGEPIPTATGGGGLVERITLGPSGRILARDLAIEVAPSDSGERGRTLGLYPPSLYRGLFVYPRYLGVAARVGFTAPDLPSGREVLSMLNVYPAGREDRVEIPGSPYRIVYSMAEPADGTDPYVTGKITLLFKLLKGEEVVFTGSAAAGGEFSRDGYHLVFPGFRRMVITDFVKDYGVLLIWTAGILFIAGGCFWFPVKFFLPRREMLFMTGEDVVHAYSREEGWGRRHRGTFHEALDLLETGVPERQAGDA